MNDVARTEVELDALLECVKLEELAERSRPNLQSVSARGTNFNGTRLEADVVELSAAVQETPRMLVADDDPAIVRLLAERCTSMGFTVDTAANGLQALIKARRSPPDVMVIDVNMPGVDGLSVCARLLGPGGKSVEVVVVTGSTDPETIKRCESLGAFYGHKGPHFWNNISSALAEVFPGMAGSIMASEKLWTGAEVHQRSRVLLIDDDPDTEQFLASRLSKYGVDLLCAPDGAQGFKLACKEQPSVIMTDFSLEKGNVTYLLWKLRCTPVTANIPIFVLSGRELDEPTEQILKREVCGKPGVAKFFRKSFDTDELFGALQEFCGFDNHVEE